MKKRCFLSAAVCLMLTACSIGNSADTVRFFAFDTFISAEITSSSHDVSSECAEEIRSAFEKLDNVFSPYNENSEIYSFNSGKADIADSNIIAMTDRYKRVRDILGDGLDVISDDLGDVEDIVYDEDEDDYEDEEDDEDDEEECYATTCPECEEEIFFDDSVLEDGKVECPNCGATLEFDPADLVEDEEEKDD